MSDFAFPAQAVTTLSREVFKGNFTMIKEPVFSPRKIPPEAEPVKFAQSLFVLAVLLLLVLSLVLEGVFFWVFPVSIPFAGYYAFTVYKTGYAIWQQEVYKRGTNPITYNAFLWGILGYILVAILVWVG